MQLLIFVKANVCKTYFSSNTRYLQSTIQFTVGLFGKCEPICLLLHWWEGFVPTSISQPTFIRKAWEVVSVLFLMFVCCKFILVQCVQYMDFLLYSILKHIVQMWIWVHFEMFNNVSSILFSLVSNANFEYVDGITRRGLWWRLCATWSGQSHIPKAYRHRDLA